MSYTVTDAKDAEIARLRAELAHQTEMADVAHKTAVQMREEAERLRAEVAGVAHEAFAWQSRAEKAEAGRDRLRELLDSVVTEVGRTLTSDLRNRIDAALGGEER